MINYTRHFCAICGTWTALMYDNNWRNSDVLVLLADAQLKSNILSNLTRKNCNNSFVLLWYFWHFHIEYMHLDRALRSCKTYFDDDPFFVSLLLVGYFLWSQRSRVSVKKKLMNNIYLFLSTFSYWRNLNLYPTYLRYSYLPSHYYLVICVLSNKMPIFIHYSNKSNRSVSIAFENVIITCNS